MVTHVPFCFLNSNCVILVLHISRVYNIGPQISITRDSQVSWWCYFSPMYPLYFIKSHTYCQINFNHNISLVFIQILFVESFSNQISLLILFSVPILSYKCITDSSQIYLIFISKTQLMKKKYKQREGYRYILVYEIFLVKHRKTKRKEKYYILLQYFFYFLFCIKILKYLIRHKHI